MQHNILGVANLLVHQKALDIRSLIARQLNDFSGFLVFLHGPVARKVLFERLANAFHVQIVGESGHCGNTFTSIALLYAYMNFLFRRNTALVSGVLKGVCRVRL